MTSSRTIKILGKHIVFGLTLIFLANFSLTSCYNPDDIEGNLYTFDGQNLGQYLKAHPDEFSEFTKLLDTVKVMNLLNTYGTYTCFAPTNSAMRDFYQKRGKANLYDFTIDSLKIIAYDHIISKDSVFTTDFVDGRLPDVSMSNRYISVTFINDSIFLNKTSPLLTKNIRVHNGVIHVIGEVLDPIRLGIVDLISEDSRFTLYYEALLATGLADSLLKTEDESYDDAKYTLEPVSIYPHHDFHIPKYRKYGYTIFMESNSTLAEYNITDLSTMKTVAANIYDEVYPQDAGITDITDRKNSLNRFIAYHMLSRNLDISKLIDAYDSPHMLSTKDMFEYFETMCPNTLIEVSKIRSLGLVGSNQINRIPETGEVVHITNNYNFEATNGIYHEIDKLLTYNKDVVGMLSSKRLRFDFAAFFDELANNNMRGHPMTTANELNDAYYLPNGYIERFEGSEQTVLTYLTAFAPYLDYQGDEVWLKAESGKLYDFTITTYPVPAGTYEVRFGYQPTPYRGVAQMYFDYFPAGLPVNFNNLANNESIGWEEPGSVPDDPYGYDNDKLLRNHGYMKGPGSFKVIDTRWYRGIARNSVNYLRKILGTYTFNETTTHTFTVKGLSNGEFVLDFIEFAPTSVIEFEDVD